MVLNISKVPVEVPTYICFPEGSNRATVKADLSDLSNWFDFMD